MTLNHMRDGVAHDAGRQHLCRYQDQYDNLFYLCKVQCSCMSLLLDAAYCYSSVCLSIRLSVAHDTDRQHLCHYQDQYDNLFYLCKVLAFQLYY